MATTKVMDGLSPSMCISYFRVCRIDVIDIPVEMTVNFAASIHGGRAMGVGFTVTCLLN